MPQPAIRALAALSDQRTVALVDDDGVVQWMCAPRFDDEPIFAALLDERGGFTSLRPTDPAATAERSYVPGTNVLQTRWRAHGGEVVVTEALVALGSLQRFSQLLRKVEPVAGEVELAWVVRPRFGWSYAEPEIRGADEGFVLHHGDLEMLVETHGMPRGRIDAAGIAGTTTVAMGGDPALLSVMVNHAFPLLASSREDCNRRLASTRTFWEEWMAPLRYDGPYEEAVRRSMLTIGACVHDQTGAVVAAPTTSLPEAEGGERNWDYRYCWVRDTCFALDVATRLGMGEFAQATLGWLLRAERRTHPRLNVFFTLDGEPYAPATEVDATGWHGSAPVREGNDAGDQLQLGSFGDLFETAWLFVRAGHQLDADAGVRLAEVADYLCEVWRLPDSGIWELGDLRSYSLSRMQAWSALDRAIKLAGRGQLTTAGEARWRSVRDDIRAWVDEHCFADDGTILRDGDGSGELDCGALIAPRTGFMAADDPRYLTTVARLREELGAGDGLLYRYTGMREEEGAFLPCSFWMAEGLARAGRKQEATDLMDVLLPRANDVGLFSEELRATDGALLGNTPQALTHLALISAALAIAR
jgi:GH15 family glucan-1,4-alpha-glucosidase